MYTVWRHNLCLSFGKISPCAVAAGSVLYLLVLSPLEGGAQCLSVIKVFVWNAQTVFTSCGTKWAGRCPTSVTLRFWNYRGNEGRAFIRAHLRMCTACWTLLELNTFKEPLEEQHGAVRQLALCVADIDFAIVNASVGWLDHLNRCGESVTDCILFLLR